MIRNFTLVFSWFGTLCTSWFPYIPFFERHHTRHKEMLLLKQQFCWVFAPRHWEHWVPLPWRTLLTPNPQRYWKMNISNHGPFLRGRCDDVSVWPSTLCSTKYQTSLMARSGRHANSKLLNYNLACHRRRSCLARRVSLFFQVSAGALKSRLLLPLKAESLEALMCPKWVSWLLFTRQEGCNWHLQTGETCSTEWKVEKHAGISRFYWMTSKTCRKWRWKGLVLVYSCV